MKERINRPIIGINSSYMEDAYKWYKVPINYINAIYAAGGLPLIMPCDPSEDQLHAYIENLDGMVFTGGADYPSFMYGELVNESVEPMHNRRADTDIFLVKTIIQETNIPVLGICAGHQLLAIAHGGKLIQNLPNVACHEKPGDTEHSIEIKGGKWLKSIFKEGSINVNSNHHQAIMENPPVKDFEVVARAEDGVIEAIEYTGERYILGLQWHPERTKDTEHTKMIFNHFIGQIKER